MYTLFTSEPENSLGLMTRKPLHFGMINRCPRFGNIRAQFFPIEKGFTPRRFVFATGKLNATFCGKARRSWRGSQNSRRTMPFGSRTSPGSTG